MDILYKSLEVCVAMIFRDDFESEKQCDKSALENEKTRIEKGLHMKAERNK